MSYLVGNPKDRFSGEEALLFLCFFQIDNHDTVEMGSDAEVKWISHLLDLSEDWLKQALTQKVTVSFLF